MAPEKKTNKSCQWKSSRGQATLEYILLLVISVGIILMFSKRFSQPFGEYLNSYFGGYLACLLDKGVLPKLGSEEDECSDSFQVNSSNPFGKKSGGKGGLAGDQGSGQQNARPSEFDEMAASRSGNGAGRKYGRMSSRRFTPRGTDGGAPNPEKVTTIPNPMEESKFYKVSKLGPAERSRGKMIQLSGLSGLLADERERLKKREARISKAGVVESDASEGRGKRMVVKPPERKVSNEIEAQPLTFGKFVRILIILAILLAILIFLGSQLNQISKSTEK